MLPALPAALVLAPERRGPVAAVTGFVRALAARGWRVGGDVPASHGISSGGMTSDGAGGGGLDLLVLDGLPGAGAPVRRSAIRRAQAAGTPVLLIARGAVPDASDRPPGAVPLWPDPVALWRWWGVARMLEERIRAVPDAPAQAVLVGYNWTLVQGPAGIGLAATPRRGEGGARTTAATGALRGAGLAALAGLARSRNPYERSVGIAAINASLNRPTLDAPAGDGLDPPPAAGRPAAPTAVIGRFPGLADKLPGALVLEREPGPGDLPDSAAPDILPGCARVVITASTLVNGTLAGLLPLCGTASVTLLGPGTPLSPALHDYGIARLSGFVVDDPDGIRQAVAEGAGARRLLSFGRRVTLTRGPASE